MCDLSPYEICEIKRKAEELNLSGWQFLHNLSYLQIARSYNGVGPEWMKPEWRLRLTKHYKLFGPCCAIHDCRFDYDNDGSRDKFEYANSELEKNCKKLARLRYKWYDIRRYYWLNEATFLAESCRAFGWKAYQDARKKQLRA